VVFSAELRLLFRRRRTWALLALLGLVPLAAGIAIKLAGGPGSGGPAFIAEVGGNGVVLALAGLTVSSAILLPLSVAIVAGDAIAGEANFGTLRVLLLRPVSRSRLLGAKLLEVCVFALFATLVVAIVGLVVGVILFPVGPVPTLSGTEISLADGILRVLGAAVVLGWSMWGLGSVGVFFSTLTDTPVGAMAATAALFIACLVVQSLPELRAVAPFLLTHDWDAFGGLLRSPPSWSGIRADAYLQLAWGSVAAVAAWARLTTLDVLN
jgi:ABC-2 type transport system permease protein